MERIKANCDQLKIMTSCRWKKIKASLEKFPTGQYAFIGKQTVSENDIIKSIESENFYGIIKCDVSTPAEVIEKFHHLNFPLIFNRFSVEESMLSESMRSRAKNSGYEFPTTVCGLTWQGSELVLSTPLARFYLSLGMRISNIQWAAEFLSSSPFEHFVRKEALKKFRSLLCRKILIFWLQLI